MKQVEIHILHLHSTGIFQKKQKEKSNSSCGIKNSEEESKKWREERKKNFPSVSKSEQAKRQRQLKYDRKIKSIETRKQKELEREEEWKRRKEEREKISDTKEKRQNRRKKRKHPEENQEQKKLPSDVSIQQNIDTKGTENSPTEEKVITNVTESIKETANLTQHNTENNTGSKRPKYAAQANNKSIPNNLEVNLALNRDQPFWYGYIEPFKGTKHNYEAHSVNLVTNNKVTPLDEATISEEESSHNLRKSKVPHKCKTIVDFSVNKIDQSNSAMKAVNLNSSAGLDNQQSIESDDEPPDESPILRKSSMSDQSNVTSNEIKEMCQSEETVPVKDSLCPPGTNADRIDDAFATKQHKNQEVSSSHQRSSDTNNLAHKTNQRHSFKILRKSIHPPTLLEKLLTSSVEKERDELLQCIRYVVDNKFLQK